MKKILSILIICLLALSACVGCTQGADDGKFKIVCSSFAQYDFIRVITEGNENVKLTLLSENGEDMHSFEPTSSNILAVADADILVYTGGVSDTWVDGMLTAASNSSLVTVKLFDLVTPDSEDCVGGEHEHDGEHGHEYDEHLWTSPKNTIKIVEGLCDLLCREDPDSEELYRENTEKYLAELSALDLELEKLFSKKQTMIFADRFPFLYFVNDYGIEYYAAFPGCTTEQNASFDVVMELVERVREANSKWIFEIDGSNSSIAKTVAGQTGAGIKTLYSCQSVTKAQIEQGATYLGYMKQNLATLKEVFG